TGSRARCRPRRCWAGSSPRSRASRREPRDGRSVRRPRRRVAAGRARAAQMTVAGEELAYASVAQLRELLESGRVGAEELVRSAIERIERLNPALNAVVAVRAEA